MSSAHSGRGQLRWSALPISLRLAGGSALLTLVILMAFAIAVGTFTTRQIRQDFFEHAAGTVGDLQRREVARVDTNRRTISCNGVNLDDFATAENAVIRVI